MPELKGVGQIASFKAVEVIGNFISNNVTDIRTDRKNPRWVFPTMPKDRANYPTVVVELKTLDYTDNGAGMFLGSELTELGNYNHYYQRECVADIRLTILTEKESKFQVTRNDTGMYLTNQPLNLFLANKISDAINWNKEDLLGDFIDIRVMKKTPVFEDDPHAWASEIILEAEMQDVWVKEYDSTGELVDQYSLTLSVGAQEEQEE